MNWNFVNVVSVRCQGVLECSMVFSSGANSVIGVMVFPYCYLLSTATTTTISCPIAFPFFVRTKKFDFANS